MSASHMSTPASHPPPHRWRPNRRMSEKGEEVSLDSTARLPPPTRRGALLRGGRSCPAIRRGGAATSAGTGRGGAREVSEASRPGASRVAPTDLLEAERQDKLYHKVMFLYYQLASPEEQIRMAEPIGWRPELPTNISLQEQLRILQARLDAKHPPAPPSAPADP
jgi:hypothetical protein